MKKMTIFAAALALLVGSVQLAGAENLEMNSTVSGMVFQNGKPVSEATVEFVVTREDGKSFYFRTRTTPQGMYRIEGIPYGVGYAKISTSDSRGPATEYVEIFDEMVMVNFSV